MAGIGWACGLSSAPGNRAQKQSEFNESKWLIYLNALLSIIECRQQMIQTEVEPRTQPTSQSANDKVMVKSDLEAFSKARNFDEAELENRLQWLIPLTAIWCSCFHDNGPCTIVPFGCSQVFRLVDFCNASWRIWRRPWRAETATVEGTPEVFLNSLAAKRKIRFNKSEKSSFPVAMLESRNKVTFLQNKIYF